MKTLVLLALAAFVNGCTSGKEIQANFQDVELVKIDTITRYPNITEQQLTWLSSSHISYVTFEPIANSYPIGARMKVIIPR